MKNCDFKKSCTGCQPLADELSEQQSLKTRSFVEMAKAFQAHDFETKVHNLQEAHLRERLDFTISDGKFGLQSKDSSAEIVDLPTCLMITPELQNFLTEFRKINWPIRKGSVRLRVAPDGTRGMWLDFANTDIQNLIAEKSCFEQALALGYVEIGQRRKKLILTDRFRLTDPELHVWTQSFSQAQALNLYSCVGSFTQTGRLAQKAMSSELESFLQTTHSKRILELGCGIGTLTLTAAKTESVQSVFATDFDELALHGLNEALNENQIENVLLSRFDFHRQNELDLKDYDTLLLNPARSGAGTILTSLPQSLESVIYMSCYPKSFFQDFEKLAEQGFYLKKAVLIDQFPQTEHAEWLCLIQRN